jgi:excisionase family DNA binding protein
MSLETSLTEIVTAAILPLTEQVQSLRVELAQVKAALPPKFGTVADAARVLGVSEQTIRRKAELGEIPSTRIGRSVRIDLSALRPIDATKIAELAIEARGRS